MNQTFSDIEIIVVNDGSTDNTEQVVTSIPDQRIRYVRCETNRGPGAARNEGLRVAQGKYIAFLDSDDEWLPEKLKKQVELMDAQPLDVGVCCCGDILIKNEDYANKINIIPSKDWGKDSFQKCVTGEISFHTSVILIRRECLAKIGLMNAEMRVNEDQDLLLRLLCYYGLSIIPEMHVITHLAVSNELKKAYTPLINALPFNLRHRDVIRQRLGKWTSVRFECIHRTNVMQAAIRERRWRKAGRQLYYRLQVFPLLFPYEGKTIIKAFLVAVGVDKLVFLLSKT